jgi:pantoate--beta-alanine ligase
MIHKTLNKAKEMIHTNSIERIQSDAMTSMNIPGFKPEYFTIINGHTLETIESISGVKEVVACTAVWAGEVRLIDNMRLIVEDETSTT